MWWIVFFILVFLLISAIKIIPQNHVAIVEQLGKFNRVIPAGVNIVIPLIEKVAVKVNLSVRNFLFEFEAVSKDKVNIVLKANLIYSIEKDHVYSYWYELSDPKQTLASFVENYVRSFVAGQTHEELLEKRDEISKYLVEHLYDKFSGWGMKIDGFQVTDIVFPAAISDAMSKVVASVRLREAAMNEAEAKKVRVVKEAEAEKDSRILMGEGVAGERQAIIDGLKRSIDDMKGVPGLNTHEVMNLIVLSQYFDTIKSIGNSQNSKVMFMNPAPKGASDIIQELSSALEMTSTGMGVPPVTAA